MYLKFTPTIAEGDPARAYPSAELVALQGFLTECEQGNAVAAVVTGTAASGKSELLQAFTELCAEADATVLSALCVEAEKDLPFAAVLQLFHSPALPPALRGRATELLAEAERAGLTGRPSTQLMLDLFDLVRDLADTRPVVVTVDDFHHVDTPSLHWLVFLMRRMRTMKVVVVLTESLSAKQSLPLLGAEFLRLPHCRRIRLKPLGKDEIAGLVPLDGNTGEANTLVTSLHQLSGGNPLLAQALLEDLRVSGIPLAPETRPIPGDNYHQAVAACLQRGDQDTRALAGVLAVLGKSEAVCLAVRVAGIDQHTAGRAITLLHQVGLLDAGRFRHPMTVTAVLADVPVPERAHLHERAAVLLHEDGASVLDVARHLVAADRAGQPWAITVLRNAAELAMADNKTSFAVQCLKLACRVSDDEALVIEMVTQLAGLEWRNNPAIGAAHLDRLYEVFRAGELPVRAAAILVRFLLWHGRAAEATEVLDSLGETDGDGDERTEAELRITRLFILCSYPTLRGKLPQPTAAERVPARSYDPNVQAAMSLGRIVTSGPDDDAIASAEHVLKSIQLGDTMVESVRSALFALIYADRLDKAVPWCDLLQQEAADCDAPSWQAVFAAARAEMALRQGDLVTAEKQAKAALTYISPQSWGVAVGVPLATLCLAAAGMGKFEEAAAHINQPVPASMLQTRFGLHYLRARGRLYLETDRVHAALGDFVLCGELSKRWDFDLPVLVPWRSDTAEAYLRLGRPDKARALNEEQLTKLTTSTSHVRGISLRLKAKMAEPQKRPELLREAVKIFQAGGIRLELARALGDLSRAHYTLAESGRARTVARQAWHIAKGCHAEVICRDLRPDGNGGDEHAAPAALESAELTAERELIESLSEAERRVAGLASLGHTNRAIASKLYITVSTVEQHLTRVYRKLDVNRRRDLPSWLQVSVANSA
ncbi:helix-turn-helix transcriptional regulator [Amycolatopsis sp. lyj-112]|uniref:helix-turn-helix transcriptional regulator n=1 Tax=Amycolatopsis sp. lyj-112 TaxID=2789288 RepID=UPI00397E8C65